MDSLMFQRHVIFRSKTQTSTQNVFDTSTLFHEGIDDRSSWRNHRGLEQVRKNRQNRMETFKRLTLVGTECNAFKELGQEDEVEDDGGGQERVLARVVHGDGIVAVHEDLRRVLVHG